MRILQEEALRSRPPQQFLPVLTGRQAQCPSSQRSGCSGSSGFPGSQRSVQQSATVPLNCLLHDLYLWNLHDKVINHLVHRINHSFQLGLTVNHTPVELLVDLGTTSLQTLQELRVHGQTDRMSHSRIVLGDLVGFDTSVTGIFAGFALCLACCKFGKVSVVVTFHLVVKRLRLIGARRSDEFLVRECKDAFTDLLELIFHFRDVFSRV